MTVSPGFLNLNKPAGLTSHDCVAQVRRLVHLKRIGHAGTLDPAATGVLPLALGRATRLLQFLLPSKAYRATIRLGHRTTTDDLAGETIRLQPGFHLDLEQVQVALSAFQGTIQQTPPLYSALQVQGKRLYQRARAGECPEIAPRPVEIDQIDLLDWRPGEFPELDLAIACGPGTYIRAIARDLGEALGTGGTLAQLTRTVSSGFALAESLTLETVANQIQAGSFYPIPEEVALAHLPEISLPPDLAIRWCHGQRLPWDLPAEVDVIRVYGEGHQFLGIGQRSPESLLLPKVVLVDGHLA